MFLIQTGTSLNSYSTVSQYVAYVNSLPLLTEEEEKTLLKDFIKNKNQNSGKKVAEAHLRVVVRVAMEFRKYSVNNMWDIISEGNIGLLKALKNFSLEKGVRFVTYATLWVQASIQEFILRSSSNLKISIGQTQKKILFNLGKVKAALSKYSGQSPSTKEIAKVLQVPESEILYLSNAVASHEVSLDVKKHEEGDATVQDFVPSETSTPEESFIENQEIKEDRDIIDKAFSCLDERERTVITKRFLLENTSTLSDLAKEFHVSVERVRQIESASLVKMKKLLRKNAN